MCVFVSVYNVCVCVFDSWLGCGFLRHHHLQLAVNLNMTEKVTIIEIPNFELLFIFPKKILSKKLLQWKV